MWHDDRDWFAGGSHRWGNEGGEHRPPEQRGPVESFEKGRLHDVRVGRGIERGARGGVGVEERVHELVAGDLLELLGDGGGEGEALELSFGDRSDDLGIAC